MQKLKKEIMSKTNIITVRVNEEDKEMIEKISFLHEKPSSEVVRTAITKYLDDIQDTKPKGSNIDLIQTLGFGELVFWILEKREDARILESYLHFERCVDLIQDLNKHPIFTPEVLVEFNKIARELEGYLNDEDPLDHAEFHFPKPTTINGFNYQVFKDFMSTIRDHEDFMEVLYIG